jgi:hypothetical protein
MRVLVNKIKFRKIFLLWLPYLWQICKHDNDGGGGGGGSSSNSSSSSSSSSSNRSNKYAYRYNIVQRIKHNIYMNIGLETPMINYFKISLIF